MFVNELFEAASKQVLVILPGRFQPPHKGHAEVFRHLCQKYGTANVFICTSDKVEPPKSPFNFKEKQLMWAATGVPADKVKFDPQPYRALSIVENYDAENTVLIFAISEKDMAEDPRFQFKPKKDGSPSYFQPLTNINEALPLSQHGYITTVPTFNFEVLGEPANSATQIRAQFSNANEDTQMKIVTDLFGKFNPAVFELMQEKLSAHRVVEGEGINDTDDTIDNALLNPDPKIRALAHAVVKMKHELHNITGMSESIVTETVIHTTQLGNIVIYIDDHYLERAKQRNITHKETGLTITRLKTIEDQLREIEPGQQFWVKDNTNNVGLGMRKKMDASGTLQLLLKTVVRGAPPEQGRTPIITIS